jgi:hypothetical protein
MSFAGRFAFAGPSESRASGHDVGSLRPVKNSVLVGHQPINYNK